MWKDPGLLRLKLASLLRIAHRHVVCTCTLPDGKHTKSCDLFRVAQIAAEGVELGLRPGHFVSVPIPTNLLGVPNDEDLEAGDPDVIPLRSRVSGE